MADVFVRRCCRGPFGVARSIFLGSKDGPWFVGVEKLRVVPEGPVAVEGLQGAFAWYRFEVLKMSVLAFEPIFVGGGMHGFPMLDLELVAECEEIGGGFGKFVFEPGVAVAVKHWSASIALVDDAP
ncbi:uncharacterized protein RCC_04821 [Ramularia collo-cygni]|uniref:Uncharacterized protein n=1 Tax=Ramularia collo-cygni TaxID=112498 RepID=A0A2D3V617_9PEZI|nr:uncharacterized protein RCC_04821 [Ramularia collo-cygni]CZT18976.1 uncharacterized protein RCC_04821 [Ramularia collo-cygni]